MYDDIRGFVVVEKLGNRFESILPNLELDFKKNPIEKYFFIMEKNNFEKISQDFFFENFSILEKSIFPSKFFDFPQNEKFREKNQHFFEKKILRLFFQKYFSP